MPCLPNLVAAQDRLVKNELAVTFTYTVPSTNTKRPSANLPVLVADLKRSRELASWTVTPHGGNKQALETKGSMIRLKVLLAHKNNLMTTASQAHKDIRMMYRIVCNLTFRSEHRHVIWGENLFEWTLGLANSKTAYDNDIWAVTPADCTKYRTASAMGDLNGFLGKLRSDPSFVATAVKMSPGASVYTSNREHVVKSNDAAGEAIKEIRNRLHARDSTGAKTSVASLYRADGAMQAALKSMMAAQTGTGKTSSDLYNEKKGIETFRASFDTLVGSLDEVLDEKKAKSEPAPVSPGFFQRFFQNRQKKRTAQLERSANEKLSLAKKKMDDLDTVLERIEGHYLYSINLHSHVLTDRKELISLIKAAKAEGGAVNVEKILRHLHGNYVYLLGDNKAEIADGDFWALDCARRHMTKKLKKNQAKYAKLSGKVLRLLDDSARLRTKAGVPVASS